MSDKVNNQESHDDDDDLLDVQVEGENPDPPTEDDDGESQDNDSSDDGEDDDDDDDDGDSRLKSTEDDEDGENDEDREAIRERRRVSRANRKKRAKERESSLRRELSSRDRIISDLTVRLNTIERRGTGTDLAQVDNTLQQLNNAYAATQNQLREATESQDGSAVVQATENLFKIRQRATELTNIRQALQQQSQKPQPLDPRLTLNATNWMSGNSWYQPDGKDQDSRAVRRLDNDLASEGWDPTTEEYWDELTHRVKKELPHRYEKDYNNTRSGRNSRSPNPGRKQIVMDSGTNNARQSSGGNAGRNPVTISKERKEALEQAGLWNDPKLRSKAIREMQAFDLEQKTKQQR